MSDKLESPIKVGNKGNTPGPDAQEPGGKLVSPNKSTAQKEASGHGGKK